MLEIEISDKMKLSGRMKLLANDTLSKPEFINVYKTLYDPDKNPHLKYKSEKTTVVILSTFFDVLSRNSNSEYIALNEVTLAVIDRGYCKKSKFSKILTEFIKQGFFKESVVLATNLNRKFTLISFPDNIEDLESSIQFYIDNPKVIKSQAPAVYDFKNKSSAIKLNVLPYASTSTTKTKEKNVVVLKDDDDGTSLLTILSSICPVEKTEVQSGNLLFKFPTPANSENNKSVQRKEERIIAYESTTWHNSDSVMQFKDLKVYYSILSLVYHAHVSRFNEYYYKKSEPKNITHLNIDDINFLTSGGSKESFGGTQRASIRESLQRIRKTIIELRPDSSTDLSGIVSSSSSEHLEAASIERTIYPLKELSRVEYVNGKGEWGESTMDYIIQLPDDVFNKMFSSKFHWLFPPSVLTIDELLFALYSYLRNNWVVGRTKKSFLIDDFYYQYESSSYNISEFITKLSTLLLKLSKFKGKPRIKKSFYSVIKTAYKNEYKVKLFGYNCLIDFNLQAIDVELNEDLFYEALEISSINRKSPTISNKLHKLSYFELLHKKKFSAEDQSTLKEMSDVSRNMLTNSNKSIQKRLPKMIPVINKSLGYIEIQLSKGETAESYFITLLSSKDEIDNICKNLSSILAVSVAEVSSYIYKLTPTIPRIYQSKTIEVNDYKTVYKQYLRSMESMNEDNQGNGGIVKSSINNEMEFFMLAENDPSRFKFMMSFI